MAIQDSFQQVAATVTATANGTTSVNVALPERLSGGILRIVNMNAAACFVRAGVGAQTATTADCVVTANNTYPVDIYVGAADNVAVVLSGAGTAAVYICPGN